MSGRTEEPYSPRVGKRQVLLTTAAIASAAGGPGYCGCCAWWWWSPAFPCSGRDVDHSI